MHEPPRQTHIAPTGFFVLRTPLLPFDEWLRWGAGLAMPGASAGPAAEAAFATYTARLRVRLRAAIDRPEVRDALFVASPDLDASLGQWIEAPTSERGQKVERALARYFARMAGRATPFGLFAGWAVGSLAEATWLAVAPRAACQRHTRLDMDYLFALADALGRDPAFRAALRYMPNSSLYRAAGRLRYAEARVKGRARTYHLVAVEPAAELEATLERARAGASAADLATALLVDDPEIEPEEAEAYIADLIASQILVPDLGPDVTGEEPIHGMIARLAAHPESAPIAARLDQVRAALAALDAGGIGAAPVRYRDIANMLEGLPAVGPAREPSGLGRETPPLARLFQVDTARPSPDATLGRALADQIAQGVQLLHRLAGAQRDGLEQFRQAFTARYEGREVPLVEVLDSESGIGFGTSKSQGADAAALLGGLAFPHTGLEPAAHWGARHALLLQKVEAAAQAGAQVIELTPQDIDRLAIRDPLPLPDSFAVMATVAAPSAEALADGDVQIVFQGVAGPSGARLLGRFCHADAALGEHVAAMLRAEEAPQPDALFAEVVHLPEGRIGNVLCRPTLRDYEIPYLGHSGAPQAQQIPIDDLLVSVADDRVVLRSARLGRQVVPRLTSAHNFRTGMGMYRFLCALQAQGVTTGMMWDWGPLDNARFLPRIVSGRFVLVRARWLANQEELRSLGAAQGSARFAAVQAWRVERRLPRVVLLVDGDNELPVDLDNALSVESFVDLVKGRSGATLVELFPGPEDLCARGPEGRFIHELIVPFVRVDHRPPTTNDALILHSDSSMATSLTVGEESRIRSPVSGLLSQVSCLRSPVSRSFPPGSEWLYAKLYTGIAAADQVLREVVAPVVRGAERAGAADQWFFIRYSDPDHHLRLRIHGAPERLYGEVLPALHMAAAPLLADGRIWRVQLDTYEREVERYGGAAGIGLAERLFHADSAATLAIVEGSAGDHDVGQRWRLALCGIEQLLIDLGLDTAARHALIRRARDAYAREVRADVGLTRQLGEAYRQQRKRLEPLLGPVADQEPALAAGLAALRARSDRLAPVVAALGEQEQAGRLVLADLALSFGHMHVNRLLRSAQRRQELVLYEFLDRLYEARAARVRQGERVTR